MTEHSLRVQISGGNILAPHLLPYVRSSGGEIIHRAGTIYALLSVRVRTSGGCSTIPFREFSFNFSVPQSASSAGEDEIHYITAQSASSAGDGVRYITDQSVSSAGGLHRR